MNKIVFFGNEQIAQGLKNKTTPVFDSLVSSNLEVRALVLPKRISVVSRKSYEIPIIESAKKSNIRIIYASEVDLEKELEKLNADAGVLVSYGRIVSQKIIDVFPHGIINIHPSLLPKYRGPTPVENTILNGDRLAGVSLMSLVNEMDAGPIYLQDKITLSGTENKIELCEKLVNLGKSMLIHNLPDILNGKLKPYNQPDLGVTFTQKISKSDGNLDPNTMAADECEREIRAYLGFPKTRISFLGKSIIVTKAHVEQHESEFGVQCSDGKWLIIDELIPQNGKQMDIKSYLNGIRI